MSHAANSGGKGWDKEQSKDTRKTYSQPRLVEYGSIAKLTQNGGASVQDKNGKSMSCL